MRLSRNFIRIRVAATATSIAVLSGCFIGSEKPSISGSGNGEYVKAMYSVPLTFDPAQMNDTASLATSNLLYSGLLSFTADLELRGNLAESWGTSRDGKTVTFVLRKGARFQDGSPITARDVVRSFERVVGPSSKVYNYYDCIVGAEAYHTGKASHVIGLRAAGEAKVEIELRYPFPPFLSVLAGATAQILPEKSDRAGFFENPVGSGPFKLLRIEKKEKYTDVVLERSELYFGEKPKVARLILRGMDEAEALKQAAEGVVHDLASYPLTGKEDVFKSGTEVLAPVAATWIIGMNTRLSPFDDLSVRRGFKKSVDSEGFRKEFHPDAVPANGYIPPGIPGFKRAYEGGFDGTAATVSKKTIRIAIPEELARANEMKGFLEKNLRARGWNAEVVPMKWEELMKGYSDKSLQLF